MAYLVDDDPTSSLLMAPGMAMAAQAAQNLTNMRMGGGIRSPIDAYQRAVFQRAQLDQQRKMLEQQQQLRDLQMQAAQAKLDAPAERKILEDAAGVNRYVDTGEQVFPGVTAPPDEKEFDKIAKLRKEFRDETAVFQDQQGSFGRIIASAREPSAAGDLALIFNYMKLLDPGSVVREGEFATAQNAAGVPDRIRNQYNKIMTGERLGDDQRSDFVSRSADLYKEAAKGFENSVGEYTDLASTYEYDPAEIILRSVRYTPDTYQDLLNLQPDDELGDIP